MQSTVQFETDNKKDCNCPVPFFPWHSMGFAQHDINDSGIWMSNWPKKLSFFFFFFFLPFKFHIFHQKATVIIAALETSHIHVDLGACGREDEG